MKTIREFVIDESIILPPIAAKADGVFDTEQLTVEQTAYADIVAQYNASGQTTYQPYILGRLGVLALFGTVDGLTILNLLEQAATANSPLSPAIAELLTWMAPGAPGIDLGNVSADILLDGLVGSGILTIQQKQTLDALRTKPIIIDELQAWNELHTWVEGRPE